MAKLITLFTFLCVVAYVTSLTCYSCSGEKECMNPTTVKCNADQKYCISAGVKKAGAYHKGCYDKDNVCSTKDSDGKKAYPECESCKKDKCNKLKFQ